jgi:hypothetical protein
MSPRGFKSFGRTLTRGFKQAVHVAHRGAKHAPGLLKKADKFATKAANASDTVGTYAHLPASDTGNTRAAEFGNNMLQRADTVHNKQGSSAVLNQLRRDFR